MPENKQFKIKRIYNFTSSPTFRRLDLGASNDYSYQVKEFRVYPADYISNASLSGVLTLAKDTGIEPGSPSFKNTNEFAWANYSITNNNVIPAPGVVQGVVTSHTELIDDEVYFDSDIYLSVVNEIGTMDVNYFIKIIEFTVRPAVGALIMQSQYGQRRSLLQG